MSSRASRTIYVGNLPGDVREREIEDLFYKVTDFIVTKDSTMSLAFSNYPDISVRQRCASMHVPDISSGRGVDAVWTNCGHRLEVTSSPTWLLLPRGIFSGIVAVVPRLPSWFIARDLWNVS